MRKLLTDIEKSGCTKLNKVLHVGAGMCRELEDFLRLDADSITLVEAHPERAERLRQKVSGIPRVEVISAGVAGTEGASKLWLLNNPNESSLCQPTHLLEHYPNLRMDGSVPVMTTTLSGLIEHLVPDPAAESLLLMELQGLEVEVVSATAEQMLQKFSWIAVRTSPEVLFENGARLETVNALLYANGFQPASFEPANSPLLFRPILYQRDPLRVQFQALRSLLDEREKNVVDLTQSLIDQQDLNRRFSRLLEQQSHAAAPRADGHHG